MSKTNLPRLTPKRKQLLADAVKIIKRGWIQGRWAVTPSGDSTGTGATPVKVAKVCAIGGLERAIWLSMGSPKHNSPEYEKYESELGALTARLNHFAVRAARNKFADKIVGDDGDYVIVCVNNYEDGGSDYEREIEGVMAFNDTAGVTKKDVLGVFAAAGNLK